MDKQFDVAIVGCGPSGAITGAYLTKAGLNTVVLEEWPEVGGPRYSSFSHAGFHLDRCNHVVVTNTGENNGLGWWVKAAFETGADIKWEILPSNAVYIGGKILQLPYCTSGIAMASLIKQMFPIPIPEQSLKELAKLGDAGLAATWDELNSERMDTTPFINWVRGITQDKFTEAVMRLLCAICLVDPKAIEYTSAAAMVSVLLAGFLGGRQSYVRAVGGPPHLIPKAFGDVITKNGGQILTRHKVTKVIIKDGKAKGVVAVNPEGMEETYLSKYVVMATNYMSVRPLLGENIPKEIDEIVEGLYGTHTTAVDVFFGLKKEVTHPHYCQLLVVSDTLEYEAVITVPTHFEPAMCPPGKQAIDCEKLIHTSEFKNRPLEEWVKQMTATVERLLPDVKGQVEWTKTFVASPSFHHGLNAVRKLPLKCPEIENLYFCGDCTLSPGLGTERTASSGMKVAQQILSK